MSEFCLTSALEAIFEGILYFGFASAVVDGR